MQAEQSALPAHFPQFVESSKRMTQALADDRTGDLHVRFKAHPLLVLKENGAPVQELNPAQRAELEQRLGQADLLIASSCYGCKIGLEVALITVGGIAACAVTILLAPEALATAPFIVAAAAWAGIEAATAATIFLATIATVGAAALAVFNSFIEAICEKIGSCQPS
jgi:hypothetical protein